MNEKQYVGKSLGRETLNREQDRPERNREIPSMLKEIDDSVDRLSNTVSRLIDRLQPALSTSPAHDSEDKVGLCSSCDIASRLISVKNKADALNSIMHDAIDRLEI